MKRGIIKYIFVIVLVYSVVFLTMFLYDKDKNKQIRSTAFDFNKESNVVLRNIIEENERYSINVSYPKYSSTSLNKEVTDFIYKYINDFKENCPKIEKCKLNITYEIYDISIYSNIFFHIDSSLIDYDKQYSIFINNEEEKKTSIEKLFPNIKEKIDNELKKKYPSIVSSINMKETLDDYAYYLTDDYIKVYFKHKEYEIPVSYEVMIKIYFNENNKKYEIDKSKKLVALTFDDGPSDYSSDIMDAFISNDGRGTFFVIGNRLEKYRDVLLKEFQSGFDIGSHTYDHKYLTKISDDEILNELNSTNIIYNGITDSNLNLLRPPYGSYNDNVKKLSVTPLILWSVDTNDWYYRDASIVYENILTCEDGDIVLMHDLYPETLEAVKRAIPELKARGYELVTVSELSKLKNISLDVGNAYRFIR